jgi:dienelactone hydrolase
MNHMRRTAFVAVLAFAPALIASAGLSWQAPRLEITPGAVLVDERFRISLDGLKPGQDVTIRVDGNRGVWQSRATFRSDDRGRVEIADPMRLVWSVTGTPVPAAGRLPVPQPWVFTAEVDGRAVATQTILRRALAEDVRVVPVRERGLVGTAYFPPGAGPHPAMIVLPGSQGGIPGPGAHAGGLASRGYVVFALGYFNVEGLPPLLQNIPLEYFATAVEWLKSQPSVAPGRIGVLGTSRGGELALLLGATFPSAFRVVVANVPSNVVWPGLSDDSDAPAWTLNGKPVPGVQSRWTSADLALSGRDRFLARLQDEAAVARAEIQVERIDAPVLMFSGKDDQMWPSDIFAARVVDRLKAHQFKHPVEHYSYEHAGHQMTRPFTPTSEVRQVRTHAVSKRPNMAGGTPEGQAKANEDSWEKLLAFLDKYLRNAPSNNAAQAAVDGSVARSVKAVSGATMPDRLR